MGLPKHIGVAELQFPGARAYFRIQFLGKSPKTAFTFPQHLLGAFAVGNVSGHLRRTSDVAIEILYRRNCERNIEKGAILSNADGLKVVHSLPALDAGTNFRLFAAALGSDDKGDVLADGFVCRIAK